MDTAGHDHLIRTATTVAEGIGAMFGGDCEVAVHDLRKPTESLVHLVNGHISNREPGFPIRDLIRTVLPNLEGGDVLANYPTPLPDGRVLKSTTCLLRDREGEPAVALCINYDVSGLGALRHRLDGFLAMTEVGGQGSTEPDLGDAEVLDVLKVLVRNTVAEFGKPARQLSKEERRRAVGFLDRKGAFLIKGSVPLVAEVLGISEPSVYRYVDQARSTARQATSPG